MKINPDTLEICIHFVDDKEVSVNTLHECVELEEADFVSAFHLMEKYQKGKYNDGWWKGRFDNFLSGEGVMKAKDFFFNLIPELNDRKKSARYEIAKDIEKHFNYKQVKKILGLIETCIELRRLKDEFEDAAAFVTLDEFLTVLPPEEED